MKTILMFAMMAVMAVSVSMAADAVKDEKKAPAKCCEACKCEKCNCTVDKKGNACKCDKCECGKAKADGTVAKQCKVKKEKKDKAAK
jgi:opacity protein-like surface antigen